MKTGGIWKLIPFCLIDLLFFVNSSFVESKAVLDLSRPEVDQFMTAKATDTVIIKGMAFHLQELHVHKGAVVVFINKDIVPHDVTDFPDKKWTSGILASGHSWKKRIEKSFTYYCSIHTNMKGKIIVDP